ncbi:MAG: hypothetical protein A3E78_06735 [Alphaproteobacteria bacterium RIFCSPHIGHO2_12_FULL_63_12]|nr:MAG: hypothetical protein A3E78_06735 [Alphaproteobacteria bacterium RIFCSPHIGHO2_12_FULL_63_12]
MLSTSKAVLAAMIATALVAGAARAAGVEPDIVIDPATRFQTLSGWEVSIRGWEQDKIGNRYDPTWREESAEVARKLVDDIGVNRLRLEVRSSTENPVDYWTRYVNGEETYLSWHDRNYEKVNDNNDPFVADPVRFQWSGLDYKVDTILLPVRERLAARGEKLFVTLCFVDFKTGSQGTLSFAQKPEEYAELIAATFDHLKAKYGLTPDALEIVLEPENSGAWKAERLAPAIRAATKRLAKHGYRPQIIGPSTKLAKNAVPYFITATRAGAKIDVLSYHSYDRPSDDIRRAIARQGRVSHVETAMLEHVAADVNEFYRDMTIANVSAWQQWAIAHVLNNNKYLLVADLSKPKGARLSVAARAQPLAQIWRHARIGDVRIDARASAPGLKPLAFAQPDGGVALSVIADAGGKFTIGGLPAGRYRVERTTAKIFAENAGIVTVGAAGRAAVSVPAAGVVTLFPADD